MTQLNKKQEDLLSLAEKGGKDDSLMLLDRLHELEDQMALLKSELEGKLSSVSEEVKNIPSPLPVKIEGAELVTIKGDKGERGNDPTSEELVSLIKPLIPEPIPGKNGKDGYTPVKEVDYFDGEDGKTPVAGIDFQLPKDGKDGSSDTAGQIRDKLETLEGEDRLDKSAIKGLDEELKKITKFSSRPIFGPGKTRMTLIDLSSQLNGVLKTFFLGNHFGIVGVDSSSTPFGAFRVTTDYNESGQNIVFTANVDATISLAQGQSLIVKVLQ